MSAVSGGDAENFKVVSSSPEIDPETIGAIEDDANRVNSNDSITVLIFGMREFPNLPCLSHGYLHDLFVIIILIGKAFQNLI